MTEEQKVKKMETIAMTEMELRSALYSKVNAIVKELGPVAKEGHNDFSNYDFIGYEQLNARLRVLLPKHKLAIVPAVVDLKEKESVDSKGKQVVRTIVKTLFTLVDTETGYREDREFYGADQDTQGKSFGQACSEAQKRFELKLFHISSSGDKDSDSKSVEAVATPHSVVASTAERPSTNDKPFMPPREGALSFIEKHPDLKELCHRLKFKHSEVERIVSENKFNYEKIKCAMEGVLNF